MIVLVIFVSFCNIAGTYADENENENGGSSSTGAKRSSQGNGNGSSLPPRVPDFDSWEEGRERGIMDTIVNSVLDAVSMPQRPPLEETRADNSAGIPDDTEAPEETGSRNGGGFRDRERSSGFRDRDNSETGSSKSPQARKKPASKQSSGGETPAQHERSSSNASSGSRASNKPIISLLPPSQSSKQPEVAPSPVNLLDLDDAPAPAPAAAPALSVSVSVSKAPAAPTAAAPAGKPAGEEDFADFQSAFGEKSKAGAVAPAAVSSKPQTPAQSTTRTNFADFASFSSSSSSSPSIPPAQAQSKAPIIPLSSAPLTPLAAPSKQAAAVSPAAPPAAPQPAVASASNVLDTPNAAPASGVGLLMPKQTASGLAVSIGANKSLPASGSSTLVQAPSPPTPQSAGGKLSMNAMIAGRSSQQQQAPGSGAWTPSFHRVTSTSGRGSASASSGASAGDTAATGGAGAGAGGKVGATWADFKGVDISVDRLTAIDRFKKPGAGFASGQQQPMSPTKMAPANR